MAANKNTPAKRSSAALARLTPNSVEVTIDGQEVRVALSRDDNAILNMLMAAQGRAFIQRSLKRWTDDDQTPSPKELKDLASAMRDIAQFSAEIYSGAQIDPNRPQEKTADKTDPVEIDFSKIVMPSGTNKSDKKDEQAPGTDGGRPASGA